VHGVGITLSSEQKKKFEERIKEEHLEAYLQVELLDYRDLSTLNMKFDRVVSVGMIEHVGRENYERFMSCVKEVLKPGGVFVLHYNQRIIGISGRCLGEKNIFFRVE